MEIEVVIFEDSINLINKFAECKNPSFKMFCEKWHDAKFHCIYAVQTTVIEVVQTTKAMFYLAKQVLCAKNESDSRHIYRRYAGLFLIYAIYFKQPTYQYVKVLMSYESWRNLSSFIECLPVNPLTDEVKYVFWSLYKEDAFRFTAHDYDLGLENLVDYDVLYDIHTGNNHLDSVRQKLKQKLMVVREAEEVLPGMIALEEEYNKSKQNLLSADKSAKPLPPTKIFKEIGEAIKSIQNILNEKVEDDSGTPKNVSSTSEKRKEIKRKAAGYITNDEESPEEQHYPEPGPTRGYTCSRKLMTQELPDSIKADLNNNSTDDED